jgi:FkbM family methyltransferase
MPVNDNLPFLLNRDDELSKWRAESFFTKEPETLVWLDFFGTRISQFIDVGANIGLYTMYWLAQNPGSFCIACEPFQLNSDMLVANLELNDFQSRCSVIYEPLSEKKQKATPVVTDGRVGASGYKLNISSELVGLVGVDTLTLNDLLSRIQEPCIVKIDTDGTDFEILKGADSSLRSGKVVSVLIEASEEQHKEIGEYLSQFNLYLDSTLNVNPNHSDIRRIAGNKIERNRIYSL